MESQRSAGIFGNALYAVENFALFCVVFVTAEGTIELVGNEENISFRMQNEMGRSAACVCGESLVHFDVGFVGREDTNSVTARVGRENLALGRVKESMLG